MFLLIFPGLTFPILLSIAIIVIITATIIYINIMISLSDSKWIRTHNHSSILDEGSGPLFLKKKKKRYKTIL